MNEKGHTFAEIVVVLFLVAMAAAVAIPAFRETVRSAALRGVTNRVRAQIFRARAEALRTGNSTALVFERGSELRWRCTIFMDGDGDGVRRDDIERGRDFPLEKILQMHENKAGLGILSEVPVPDPAGHGMLGGNLDDPVRAGSGDIMTFTRDGTATSGTLYFSDGHSHMRALRVYGVTARVRSLAWQKGWDRWRLAGL